MGLLQKYFAFSISAVASGSLHKIPGIFHQFVEQRHHRVVSRLTSCVCVRVFVESWH